MSALLFLPGLLLLVAAVGRQRMRDFLLAIDPSPQNFA